MRPFADHVPSISPQGAEDLAIVVENAATCAWVLYAQMTGDPAISIPEQCRGFGIEMGEAGDGVAQVTLIVGAVR